MNQLEKCLQEIENLNKEGFRKWGLCFLRNSIYHLLLVGQQLQATISVNSNGLFLMFTEGLFQLWT
jgi:hypothetical protein